MICLTVWAFILVAASFALSGREFMFPVALVTAFIGESHNRLAALQIANTHLTSTVAVPCSKLLLHSVCNGKGDGGYFVWAGPDTVCVGSACNATMQVPAAHSVPMPACCCQLCATSTVSNRPW